MQCLIVTRSFFALNRPELFEPAAVLDPNDVRLQADLAVNGVPFGQFAAHLVEQGLAQWSEEQ